MNLKIVTIEDEEESILLQPTTRVLFPLSKEDQQLIFSMKDKLGELEGVGLAAPQINSKKSMIAIYIPENAALLRDNSIPYPMHILINPEYESLEDSRLVSDFESCYSVKSKAGCVPRYDSIKLKYQDEKGNILSRIETGFYARVLQH